MHAQCYLFEDSSSVAKRQLETDMAKSMAGARRAKFSRRMSSDELVDWLHDRGVGETDRKKFKGRL